MQFSASKASCPLDDWRFPPCWVTTQSARAVRPPNVATTTAVYPADRSIELASSNVLPTISGAALLTAEVAVAIAMASRAPLLRLAC